MILTIAACTPSLVRPPADGASERPPDAATAPPIAPSPLRPPDAAADAEAPRAELIAPALTACTKPPCIDVYNNCPIPLWIHAIATVSIDGGNVRRLEPGQQWQYADLPPFGGGRLYAYYKEPPAKQDAARLVSDYNQFVEMTIDRDAQTGAIAQNYNISYVDYLSLPVRMKAAGGCADTTCGAVFDDWLAKLGTCPTELRNREGRLGTCMGSYNHCITPDGNATYDTTRPYCSKMRDAYGFPGSAIYGGVFPDHPATDVAFWDGVAAWNRGTTAGDPNDANYYQRQPYNDYAAWIHRDLGCPRVYAFSTDDHQDKAGFVRCVSPQLSVVWCPYSAAPRPIDAVAAPD